MNPTTARLLAAACIALAGCGGPALLKEARPVESSLPVAEARDARILASIDTVILRNRAGAWASNAEWDEYLVRVQAVSEEAVEVREIVLFDALDQRIGRRADRSELIDGTRDTERRYSESGRFARADDSVGGGWVILAGSGVAGAAGLGAAAAAPVFAGAAAVAAAGIVIVGGGAVLLGAGVVRLMNNSQVDNEIKRRATALPVALPGGAESKLDLFFPRTPLSARAQVVYADRHGEHRLDIETRAALALLEREPVPTLVSREEPLFPGEARRAGIQEGYVVARLSLNRSGTVQSVEVIESVPPRVFEQEARRTFRWWTYNQSAVDGRTVEARLDFKH